MTTEELFAQMEAQAATEKEYCVIDPITREISVPEVYQKIGVVSDEKTNRIYFQCPRIVGDNVDLTKYGIRVNYQNANGQTKAYPVDDVAVSGDNITFSWLLDRPVTTYKGTINFVVCAIKTSGDEITNEWNTTLAKAEVLEGLEPDIAITEDEESIVELLIAQCTQKLTEMNMAIQNSENATNDAKTATQEAVNATEDARSVIEQITKDSYLHTALESFINEVTATPTSYGNALVEKIEGYIRQNQPKGYQLFDASKITSKTQGGATVTSNGDGSFTISGSGVISEYFASNQVVIENESAKKMFKEGVVYLKCEQATHPKPYVNFMVDGQTSFQLTTQNQNLSQGMITHEMIENPTFKVLYGFDGVAQQSIVSGIIKPMLYQDGDGTWEPFIGGEPAPSPDYPQTIHGVGDMGFFDGELVQGSYNLSGTIVKDESAICNVNKINCKLGDKINITYEEKDASIYAVFFKDGVYVKNRKVEAQGIDVVDNVNEFAFYITKFPNVFNLSSAKHITVTINGMYAICVKSIGKNLSYHDKTIFSPLKCEYISDFGMLIQKTISNTTKSRIKIQTMLNGNFISQIIGGLGLGKHSVKIQKTENFNFIRVSFNGNVEDAYVPFYIGDIENGSYFYVSFNFVSDEIDKGTIEGLMITTEENTDFDFIPYQSNTTYIPISYPMFEGDQLIKRNMEYKILRKWKTVIFDGSEDETWKMQADTAQKKQFFIPVSDGILTDDTDYTDKLFIDKFRVEDSSGDISDWATRKGTVFYTDKNALAIVFKPDDTINTPELWKQWLKEHNVLVVYLLETPIEEELSPEAQKAIHSIMACDEQTTIEIVGVPTDAEVQNQFLLPRNVDGALNTTAYATSKRNEIILNEFAEQNLDSRINKLEIDNTALSEQKIIIE